MSLDVIDASSPAQALPATLVDLARVVRAITPDQEKLPTPCPGWDVLTLRRHVMGWLNLFRSALTDPAATERPDPSDHPGPEEPEAAAIEIERFVETVRRALETGFEEVTAVTVPQLGGDLPGPLVLDLLTFEVLGHGWDLARATGQVWHPAPVISLRSLAVLHGMVQPEYRGEGLPFGPEVTVAGDAPALDRLVAFTGRDPRWVPEAGPE